MFGFVIDAKMEMPYSNDYSYQKSMRVLLGYNDEESSPVIFQLTTRCHIAEDKSRLSHFC
jgi:hypothetical protein